MALVSCPECEGQVSSRARACIHCGCPLREDEGGADAGRPGKSTGAESQGQKKRRSHHSGRKRVEIANQTHALPAVLSFFIPGLGQFLKGNVSKGLLFASFDIFIFVVISSLARVSDRPFDNRYILTASILYVCVALWSSRDAYCSSGTIETYKDALESVAVVVLYQYIVSYGAWKTLSGDLRLTDSYYISVYKGVYENIAISIVALVVASLPWTITEIVKLAKFFIGRSTSQPTQ